MALDIMSVRQPVLLGQSSNKKLKKERTDGAKLRRRNIFSESVEL